MNLEELIRKAIEEMATESATCPVPASECGGHAISAGIRSVDGTELAVGIDDHRVFAADLARRLQARLGAEEERRRQFLDSPEYRRHIQKQVEELAGTPARARVTTCPQCGGMVVEPVT